VHAGVDFPHDSGFFIQIGWSDKYRSPFPKYIQSSEQIWYGRYGEKRHHPTRGKCVGGIARIPSHTEGYTNTHEFIDLIRPLSSHECRSHNEVCRQKHLREKHGLYIRVEEWLQRYQPKDTDGDLERQKGDTEIVSIIAQVTGL
jgi:hypothetical protein